MNHKISLTIVTLLAGWITGVFAQQPTTTLKQQLVGTWTFVRTEATLPDGKKCLPFGSDPKGVNTFTEEGHFTQIQIADGIPKVASNSRVTGDLHPLDDTAEKLVKSVSERRDGREEEAIYRAADHRVFEGSGSWRSREGPVS